MAPASASTVLMLRRVFAEALGTGLLVTVVVGSGIAASRLSPDDLGLQLLESSMATGLGLGVLILVVGPVSGAHVNPVVTLALWVSRDRDGGGPANAEVAPYLVAQSVGAVAGAVLANAMYDVPQGLADTARTGAGLWLGEVVATAGLVMLVLVLVRSDRTHLAAPAVGAYIAAAYWFTSSTSFANPAVTLGRAFSDSFSGIDPGSVPAFVVAQVVGALLGIGAARLLHPARTQPASPALTPERTTP